MKGEKERTDHSQGNEDKIQSEEKGLLCVWGTLHEANGKHTQKVRAETQNLKKENRKKITENYQTDIADIITRERNNGDKSNQKTKNKMDIVSPHISIVTLNVNGLNPNQKSQSSRID